MRKIYNITVGQLATLWIFGGLGWFLTLQPAFDYGSGFAWFLFIFIPFAIIFYTIGWRNHRRIKYVQDLFNSADPEQVKQFSEDIKRKAEDILRKKKPDESEDTNYGQIAVDALNRAKHDGDKG